MSRDSTVVYGSPWLLILFIILMVLKVAGVLDIGWIWVFSVFWVPIIFLITIAGIIVFIVAISYLIDKKWH